MSEFEIKLCLREWIAAKSRHVDAAKLCDDTPLFDQRMLSSLQMMDLILFIEQLSRKGIDPNALRPAGFASVNEIYRTFFAA